MKTVTIKQIQKFDIIILLMGIFNVLVTFAADCPINDPATCERVRDKLDSSESAKEEKILSTDLVVKIPKSNQRMYGIAGAFHHPMKEGGDGPEMILIPPGCMNTQEIAQVDNIPQQEKQEKKIQPVTLACVEEFAIGRYELTFAEYDYFAQATKRHLPDDAGFGRERNPVIDVSWEDARAYTAWLAEQTGESYRLPTETEWEYAARSGTDQIWPWGNKLESNQAVCRNCGSPWDFLSTAPVGTFPANSWGVHDLGGNVWEWTCSPFIAQPLFMGLVNKVQPPQLSEGNKCADSTAARVMRGGSWFNLATQLRNTYRTGQPLNYRYKTLGFRVAWSNPQQPVTNLTLRITPDDAQVQLLNPERLASHNMKLPMGRYRLRIEKPDFISFDQWVELTQPEQELDVDLKSISRLTTRSTEIREAELAKFPLTVLTNPPDASIILLDPERPYTQGMELPRGYYRLRVQAPGYESLEQGVEINQKAVTLNITLPWLEQMINMAFVRIPAGSFEMGSPPDEPHHNADENPLHTLTLPSFLMGKYDVTFAQWDACVAARGCSYRPSDQGWGRDKRPVINVSWFDANEFASWLSYKTGRTYRLPTEAEWEYAVRAGTTTAYWWGTNMERGQANCHGCGSQWDNSQTAPVGSFPPNPWGLLDATGNVWQWTCSVYTNPYDGSENRCVGKDNRKLRGLRGGSWYNLTHWMRSANRYRDVPSNRNSYTGFRLVGIF